MPIALEDPFLHLRWSFGYASGFSREGPSDEPDSYVAEYDGEVFGVDDGTDADHLIGRITARRCLIEARSPFFVLDAEHELFQYCSLFAPDGEYREAVADMPGDLLVLDRLGLAKEYRGAGLGLTVIRETIRQLGSGCSVVAMTPATLDYDHDKGSFSPTNKSAGTKKLMTYYRRLGFRRSGDVLYFDLSYRMGWPARPTARTRKRRAAPGA